MNIVWFKRDLRIHDHTALSLAAQKGPILPLYIVEPKLWQQDDLSYRHYQFLRESLTELIAQLEKRGAKLIVKVGEAVDVFENLISYHKIKGVYSHQETWNGWTFERDKAVKKLLKKHQIPWFEPAQNGVIRCLKNRDGWAKHWYEYMSQPLVRAPKKIQTISSTSDLIPNAQALGLLNDESAYCQKGGRQHGIALLKSFLHERGECYTKEMSSPLYAFESCSRLSPHLAFGTLSVREVFQYLNHIKDKEHPHRPGSQTKWASAYRSFAGRLRWHCHFIQKLEDEPSIEFCNMHPLYNGLREDAFNDHFFNAWRTGHTGYPMVDACMRALIKTGWINFRMRAMLMSFASYHLWLHWRKTALHLARLFTDYEPGIHYSQAQMQSGTTGINSIRIYNPIKQGQDHDPEGQFIKKWIPELKDVPSEFIHTPWQVPLLLGSYPLPIVDEKTARKSAADKLYALRKTSDHYQVAATIVTKHASRKKPRTRKKSPASPTHKQLELPM